MDSIIKLLSNWAIDIGKTMKMTLVEENWHKIRDKSALCTQKFSLKILLQVNLFRDMALSMVAKKRYIFWFCRRMTVNLSLREKFQDHTLWRAPNFDTFVSSFNNTIFDVSVRKIWQKILYDTSIERVILSRVHPVAF